MKKIIALLLVLVLSFGLVGCGEKTETEEPNVGKVADVGEEVEVENLLK